jgi:hypothetical protein
MSTKIKIMLAQKINIFAFVNRRNLVNGLEISNNKYDKKMRLTLTNLYSNNKILFTFNQSSKSLLFPMINVAIANFILLLQVENMEHHVAHIWL